MEFLEDGLEVVAEAHDDVEAHLFFRAVDVEAVDLQGVGMGHDDLVDGLADGDGSEVFGVVGVDADAHEAHAGGLEDFVVDAAGQAVGFFDGHGVGKLDVDGCVVAAGAVVVHHEVVGTADLGLTGEHALDLAHEIGVRPLAQDVVERLAHHVDAGLDDEARDDDADVGLERDARAEVDERRHEDGERQDGVEQRIGARRFERAGFGGLALLLEVAAEHNLDDDGHGNDHERQHAVVGSLGLDDLLARLPERGQACVEDDGRDDHGAEVLDAAMAERVLLVRLAAREFGTGDRDDGRQRVGQVVDGIEQHGDGVRRQSDGCLEGREQDVDDDADETRAHDDLPAHGHLLFYWYRIGIFCHGDTPLWHELA